VGHQMSYDCQNFSSLRGWRNHFRWQLHRVMQEAIQGTCAQRLGLTWPASCPGEPPALPPPLPQPESPLLAPLLPLPNLGPELEEAPLPDPEPEPPKELVCGACSTSLAPGAWFARDGDGRSVCDLCGANAAADDEDKALAWFREQVDGSNSPVSALEPTAKRLRASSAQEQDQGAEPDKAEDLVMQDVAEADPRQLEDRERRQYEQWWWKECTENIIALSAEEERAVNKVFLVGPAQAQADAEAVSVAENLGPEARLLCSVVGYIEPMLKPVHLGTVLIGLDSLRLARLINAVEIHFNKVVSVLEVREAKTVAQLLNVLATAEEVSATAAPSKRGDDLREFAVWFSPGQYSPMGNWVLRSDEPLDHGALLRATQQLVERHAALRCVHMDPLRYLSILFDASVVFTLYAPLMDSWSAVTRWLRQKISWGFSKAWPRVRCFTREQLYGARCDGAAPLSFVHLTGGQVALERELRYRRSNLVPPGAVTAIELECRLIDLSRWRT